MTKFNLKALNAYIRAKSLTYFELRNVHLWTEFHSIKVLIISIFNLLIIFISPSSVWLNAILRYVLLHNLGTTAFFQWTIKANFTPKLPFLLVLLRNARILRMTWYYFNSWENIFHGNNFSPQIFSTLY